MPGRSVEWTARSPSGPAESRAAPFPRKKFSDRKTTGTPVTPVPATPPANRTPACGRVSPKGSSASPGAKSRSRAPMQPSRWESSFPTIPLNSAVSAAFTASSLPLQPNTPGAAGWSAHPALSKFLNQHRLGKIVALRHFTADRPQELHVLPGRAGPKPSAANRRTPFQDVPAKSRSYRKSFRRHNTPAPRPKRTERTCTAGFCIAFPVSRGPSANAPSARDAVKRHARAHDLPPVKSLSIKYSILPHPANHNFAQNAFSRP